MEHCIVLSNYKVTKIPKYVIMLFLSDIKEEILNFIHNIKNSFNKFSDIILHKLPYNEIYNCSNTVSDCYLESY